MLKIGLLKERKIPADSRVALTPRQCQALKETYGVEVLVETAETRCFSDAEYKRHGIKVVENLNDCDLLMGIKEVPAAAVVPEKTYCIFSHTCKEQAYNQEMFHTFIRNRCTLIDYEMMKHEDGQRIIGFGFFAGVVGAHNGLMAYGNRNGAYHLDRVYKQKDFKELIHTYFGLKLPNIKIAVTGTGRVAHGIVEIMNLAGVIEVEKEEFLEREFTYPVFVQLKGSDLYRHKVSGRYNRDDFHQNPQDYESLFHQFLPHTDILMNGIYWDEDIPRLFEKEQVKQEGFRIRTIADITDDKDGSVPINYGDQTIEDPVYGVHLQTLEKTTPYQQETVDVMAVGNLPNESPRDASRYFGEQLIKYILPDMLQGGSAIIERATILKQGVLQPQYSFMQAYAEIPS